MPITHIQMRLSTLLLLTATASFASAWILDRSKLNGDLATLKQNHAALRRELGVASRQLDYLKTYMEQSGYHVQLAPHGDVGIIKFDDIELINE